MRTRANTTPGLKKKLLDPQQLVAAAAQIGAAAKKQGVHVALVGGLAMQLYGSDRLTGDVDVASSGRLSGLPAGPALSFGGEQTRARNSVPVDIILRDDGYAPLYDEAIQQAVRVKGATLPVATPEHLVAMKMASGRSRDIDDLAFLITSGQANVDKARRIIHRHLGLYAANEFDQLVDEISWRASKGRL